MTRLLLIPMRAAALCFTCVASLGAQQPRQRDLTPFERLKPLAAIASTSNAATIAQLQAVLLARGYKTTTVDRDRGELTAARPDSNAPANSDRVILWLERDPVNAARRAYIYVQYARFEPFFGSPDPVRVRLEWAGELARQAALRDTLIAFALSQP